MREAKQAGLSPDLKTLIFQFQPDDAKKLRELTKSHIGKDLLLKGADGTRQALHVSHTIDDGVLTFDLTSQPGMVAYLTRRIGGDLGLKTLLEQAQHVRARVLTVRDNAILASIRVWDTGGSEPPQLVWIDGVNTASVVDNDELNLTVYPAGKYSYDSVGGALKTVRRFATTPEEAIKLTLPTVQSVNLPNTPQDAKP